MKGEVPWKQRQRIGKGSEGVLAEECANTLVG